ncbi:TIGR04076 family protein [Desulfospira joergensenii]|uniref:TIGR04076 family protein n=1 Tax=Desulfospira joergensenii TaxID=53329 RepID=UPI0003B3FC77|nr:TIGR04076 family protein [Desulfospira joergensenii]
MSVSFPTIGNKVVARILETKRDCTIGMKPGDEFELSTHKCGDFCGLFYSNIAGWVKTLQFGGTFPMGEDPDVMVWDCPNPNNRVKVELKRIKG